MAGTRAATSAETTPSQCASFGAPATKSTLRRPEARCLAAAAANAGFSIGGTETARSAAAAAAAGPGVEANVALRVWWFVFGHGRNAPRASAASAAAEAAASCAVPGHRRTRRTARARVLANAAAAHAPGRAPRTTRWSPRAPAPAPAATPTTSRAPRGLGADGTAAANARHSASSGKQPGVSSAFSAYNVDPLSFRGSTALVSNAPLSANAAANALLAAAPNGATPQSARNALVSATTGTWNDAAYVDGVGRNRAIAQAASRSSVGATNVAMSRAWSRRSARSDATKTAVATAENRARSSVSSASSAASCSRFPDGRDASSSSVGNRARFSSDDRRASSPREIP